MCYFTMNLNQVNIAVLSEGAAFLLHLTLSIHVHFCSFPHASIQTLPFPGGLIFCFLYFSTSHPYPHAATQVIASVGKICGWEKR